MRIRELLLVLVSVIALGALLAGQTRAQSDRYMAAPDAPGSVWRINMSDGTLEHCSLVKGGCDVIQ